MEETWTIGDAVLLAGLDVQPGAVTAPLDGPIRMSGFVAWDHPARAGIAVGQRLLVVRKNAAGATLVWWDAAVSAVDVAVGGVVVRSDAAPTDFDLTDVKDVAE